MAEGKEQPKKKRPYGDGGVYQRADGRYEGTVRYEDPETGEKRKQSFYGKGPKEVAGKMRDFNEDIKKGIVPNAAAKIKVEDWLDTWLETYAKTRTRQNTYEGYKRIIENHIKPTIGKRTLKELRPEHVQKMLNERMEKGNKRTNGPLGHRQVEYIYSVLHSALERAVKNNLIVRNVCDAVDKPKVIKHEFMPWTVEETNKFLASTKESRLFPLYLTAWGTGLRRAELLGLRWEDIDLKKGTLTVRRVLVRIKGGHKFQEPKTKKSRRTVPLPDAVTEELKAWKKRLATEELKWRGKHKNMKPEEIPPFNPNKQVFPDELGNPMNPEFVSRSFKADLKKAELPEIRFHDLRHGHATMLIELGEDLKVISERLGHSTITMTADTYGHVRERLQREASNKLNQILSLGK